MFRMRTAILIAMGLHQDSQMRHPHRPTNTSLHKVPHHHYDITFTLSPNRPNHVRRSPENRPVQLTLDVFLSTRLPQLPQSRRIMCGKSENLFRAVRATNSTLSLNSVARMSHENCTHFKFSFSFASVRKPFGLWSASS